MKKAYSLVVSSYYDKTPQDLVRITAVVWDLNSDRLEMSKKWKITDDFKKISDIVIELSRKYDTEIRLISEPVQLELCGCSNSYLDRYMSAQDITIENNNITV